MRKLLSLRSAINLLVCGLALGAGGVIIGNQLKTTSIDSFEECVAAGHPVMESYPEQCAANGQTFSNPNQHLPTQ